MNDVLLLAFSFVSGFLLGLFLFGGLYLTLRDLSRAGRPLGRLAVSFLLRMALTCSGVAAVFWVSGYRWEAIVLCLAGMIAARTLLIRQVSPSSTV